MPIANRPFPFGGTISGKTRLLKVLLAVLLPGAAAGEEYRLAQGDVLRLMILKEPQLSVDVPIEMDGSAWFPLVGPIAASGETLNDLRSRTAEAFAAISVGRSAASDAGLSRLIDTTEVYLTVAAYRPIYLSGDVGNEHEIPYRPGMTLGQLLALASPAPPRDGSSQVSTGEIAAAATALAHEYARIWRLKMFLGKDTPTDFDRIFVTRGPEIDELVSVERSILAETRSGIEAQKERIRVDISRIQDTIAALVRQKDNEADGFEMDEAELARVQDLFSRNLVPASRLTDVRRASLVTASRLFQIEAALENAQGQVAKLEADILALDREARVAAWTEIGEAVTRAEQRRSDLETLLARPGGGSASGLLQIATQVIVTRDGAALASAASVPSLTLMPGDIVQVHRRLSESPDGTPQAEVNQ